MKYDDRFSIEQAWLRWRNGVGEDIPEDTVEDFRACFYSGAAFIFGAIGEHGATETETLQKTMVRDFKVWHADVKVLAELQRQFESTKVS